MSYKDIRIEQEDFALHQLLDKDLEENELEDITLLTLRCKGKNCKKVLGKVNGKGQLITESKRSGNWIKTIMEKGFVVCKKCGNVMEWDSQKLKRGKHE